MERGRPLSFCLVYKLPKKEGEGAEKIVQIYENRELS
jgi:hypothetical protein